jgi:hypothetical protein
MSIAVKRLTEAPPPPRLVATSILVDSVILRCLQRSRPIASRARPRRSSAGGAAGGRSPSGAALLAAVSPLPSPAGWASGGWAAGAPTAPDSTPAVRRAWPCSAFATSAGGGACSPRSPDARTELAAGEGAGSQRASRG